MARLARAWPDLASLDAMRDPMDMAGARAWVGSRRRRRVEAVRKGRKVRSEKP
jgi:hypothetical protein